jgi:YfiH family protein
MATDRGPGVAPDLARAGVLRASWPAPASVHTAITLRSLHGLSKPPFDACNLGAGCGDDPLAVEHNRNRLPALLDLPERPRWLRQVHGTEVFEADAAESASVGEPQADAAVAHRSSRVLAVLTADCLPVLLCAEDGSAIGIAHAGWRGLAGGVIEATLARLAVPPQSLLAWLGPAIGPRSYEVGADVRAAFVDADAEAASAFVPHRPGHWLCDLYALARRRLAAAGVHRIFGGGLDTFADPRFYSYRRDRTTGRFASLIWINTGR